MASSDKRDAAQAFGVDSPEDKSKAARKRSKRRQSGQTTNDATPPKTSIKPQNVDQGRISKSPSSSKKPAKDNHAVEEPVETDRGRHNGNDAESTEAAKKRTRSKRGRESKFGSHRSQIESLLTGVTNVEALEDVPLEIERRQEEVKAEKKKARSGEQSKRSSSKTPIRRARQPPHQKWVIGKHCGGAFINHDPVLTSDQQYLILATKNHALVYSTKTSLLIRTLKVTLEAEITSLTLVVDQEAQIIIGTSNGDLSKFDFANGRKMWRVKLSGSITAITSTSSSPDQEGLLMVHQDRSGTYHVSSLAMDSRGKLLGHRSLIAQERDIKPQICFSAELGVTVVCSQHAIMVGLLDEESENGAAPITWQTVSVTAGNIVCFDAQILPSQGDMKAKTRPVVNVAVGLHSGEIHLYNDILRESNTIPGANLLVRRMHWHRSAPKSLKWSRDSNYLISGGDETVLLMWQLDSNQKQTLPHLTAAILNIAVSANGSAYAVRLSDNSVMVLSTADLKPFANVSNLAVDVSFKGAYQPGSTVPATLHPNHPDRLLLAYSLQTLSKALKPTEKSLNMLQTFDTSAQLQLNRQALARNLVSTVNIAPDGKALHEPDVTHLDITHDGQWLITVDQWSPNQRDLDTQYLSRKDDTARAELNECFLRFWSTSNTQGENGTDQWELNTRVDDPVTTDATSQKKAILAIAINPTKLQVAVVDSSRNLKFYSPRQRMRSGLAITDAAGRQLYTWTCDHEIGCQEASDSSAPEFATLAYSEDGSVLAASWATDSYLKARVHLVNTKSAKKAASLAGIVSHGHAQLAWYGRYLLGLSEKFCIYDTITMENTFKLKIGKNFEHSKSRMAVDSHTGVVAIAVCMRESHAVSKLALFNIEAGFDRPPIFEGDLRAQTRILLPERQSSGFVVVDSDGRTFKIAPEGSGARQLVAATDVPEKKVVRSTLDNVFGKGKTARQQEVIADADTSAHRSLEDVFKFETSAEVPATKELFHQVARAIAGAA